MKIILTHDVDRLGTAGEVVEVKDGYGRNYLIPRGYAIRWTKGGQKQVDQIAEARRKRAIATLEEATAQRDALQAATLVITKNAGDNGRLFGAVTNADIAEAASELTGKPVDRRTINVATTIKSLGSYKATARLHDDILANLSIDVVAAPSKKKKK
ncbi:MAG: 50S ribosomal protein L9 [Actinomycetaceae bacterium]|nr:50S ribosomal protein L9 [Actinomycetaceae bacterium]